MGLQNIIDAQNSAIAEDVSVLEAMTEEDMSQILAVALEEVCTEEELEELEDEEDVSESYSVVEERTIVKLDKHAKKQKAYKMAILQCARDDDNPDYKKLCTLYKMEKFLTRKLEKKYSMKAKARMRETAKRANSTTKNPIKKAVNHLTRSQKETNAAMSGKTKAPSQLKTQTSSIVSQLSSKIR